MFPKPTSFEDFRSRCAARFNIKGAIKVYALHKERNFTTVVLPEDIAMIQNDELLEIEPVEMESKLPDAPPSVVSASTRPITRALLNRTPELDLNSGLVNPFESVDLDEPTSERLYRAAKEGGNLYSPGDPRHLERDDSVIVELESPVKRKRATVGQRKTSKALTSVKPASGSTKSQPPIKSEVHNPPKRKGMADIAAAESITSDITPPPAKKPRRVFEPMKLLREDSDEEMATDDHQPAIKPRQKSSLAPAKTGSRLGEKEKPRTFVSVRVALPGEDPSERSQLMRVSSRRPLGIPFFQALVTSFPEVFTGDPKVYLDGIEEMQIGFRVYKVLGDRKITCIRNWPDDFQRSPDEMGWTDQTELVPEHNHVLIFKVEIVEMY
ncbi:hypothetical protein M427DRAFT_44996 [Gonapodya prolifera JEL478]|uniref:Uncharacterized protein n=1 Tax=Gonapodya prolifera (strain JEL478) TaxID=1344416 RepID=A0A139ACQ9_GONPJ|nr:hypothetical protein M427DRAFT_44996 [Gonapodya prolifera JEL478]|eukprot:KXS14606.1 hypothetical protein M427DRAFT_44996 [Gonapodya prolifera JEL478]